MVPTKTPHLTYGEIPQPAVTARRKASYDAKRMTVSPAQMAGQSVTQSFVHARNKMADQDKNNKDQKRDRTLPSQAEDEREKTPLTPDLSTPNQAEGEREDVEETLRKEEEKQHGRK
jgi:hypothetical protein